MQTNATNNELVILDAAGHSVGRVASQAALVLRGKHLVSFVPNRPSGLKVRIINADKVKVVGRRSVTKLYRRYSGYPGGLKTETLERFARRRGWPEVLRLAIKRMLPDNKLRAAMLKNLIIEP